MDLTISLSNNSIKTRIFEKKQNLYNFLSPHSCHSPGVFYGTIVGMIQQICRLTTDADDVSADIKKFFRRLLARGHNFSNLSFLFHKAFQHSNKKLSCRHPPPDSFTIFQHITYNPYDPPSYFFQHLFHRFILHPKNEPPIHRLKNNYGAHIEIDRLIVAYHRPTNLRYLFFKRKFPLDPNFTPSNFLP